MAPAKHRIGTSRYHTFEPASACEIEIVFICVIHVLATTHKIISASMHCPPLQTVPLHASSSVAVKFLSRSTEGVLHIGICSNEAILFMFCKPDTFQNWPGQFAQNL